MASASARAGPIEPKQNFMEYMSVGANVRADEAVGARFVYQHREHIPSDIKQAIDCPRPDTLLQDYWWN